MYEYTIIHVFVYVCIHALFKDDIKNIWNFIACFESFHGCWYALISFKVFEKNRRGAKQNPRGQQAMEITRIIPMLFQKGIQRQYVGGEGEGRYDATFCGIERTWESNAGCLKWRREPCAKRNTAVAPTAGVFDCNEHHRNRTELSEPLVGEDMGKGNCECSLYYHRKPCFFCCARLAAIPVCQIVWFWSNVLLLLNSNFRRLVLVGMIVKHVEDSHHPSTSAVCQWISPDTDANKLGSDVQYVSL